MTSSEITKKVKVEFSEQSKAVTATVQVEITRNGEYDSIESLREAERLFAEAYKTSSQYTMAKSR